jgi:hypothetical protein
LIALIFGEFFLFLGITSYLGKRRERWLNTQTEDLQFFEAVWTKSKMVYAVYRDHLALFVPSSRVEIERRVERKKRTSSGNHVCTYF